MKKNNLLCFLTLFLTIAWFNCQKIYVEDKAYKDIQNTQIYKPTIGQLNDLVISYDNVNLSKGLLTPSVSLMDINTKLLNSQVSLIYKNGNGVRVNDISSDVGLGWEIEAGGYISRKVNGSPDEGKLFEDAAVGVPGQKPIFPINGNNFINGWLDFANWSPDLKPIFPLIFQRTPGNDQSLGNAFQNFAVNVQNNNYDIYKWFRFFLTGIYVGPDGNAGSLPSGSNPIGGVTVADLCATSGFGWQFYDVDGESDEYYFNFGKYSGKFVFDGNRIPVVIPHIPGLVIESPYGSNTNSWIFTTPEGTKYYFNNTTDYYEILNSGTNTAPYYDDWAGVTPKVNEGLGISENISKWYLSRIVGINGETINYNYISLPDLIYSEKAEIKQVFKAVPGSTQSPPSYFINSGDKGFYERLLDRTTNFRLKSPKRLVNITTSDNNRIDFIYNGLEREDIDQSQNLVKRKSLSSIAKYDFNNKIIEKIDFEQAYFNSGCNSYDCKRLKLDGIKKINVIDLNDYLTTSFEYNTINLPQRNSFKQDYWGFYNDNTVSSLIPRINARGGYNYAGADRSPSPSRASANILTKIIYPTKGSVEYKYELNDFNPSQWSDFPITNNKTGGLRIQSITKKDSDDPTVLTKSFTYKLENGKSSGELPALLINSTMEENNNGAGRMFERQKVEVDYTGATSVYIMIYSNLKYLFTNDLIRYSKVNVETLGKGIEEYTLSSFSTHPDEQKIGRHWISSYSTGYNPLPSVITNSIYAYTVYNTPTIFTPDKSYMRGLTLKKIDKDSNGKTIRETFNDYKMNPPGYLPKTIYGVGASTIDSFLFEDTEIKSVDFQINFHRNDFVYLDKATVKDYVNNPPIQTIESNEYNNLAFLINSQSLQVNNYKYDKYYKYANDKPIQNLINANIVGVPVETELKKNDQPISKTEVKYENAINLFPSSVLEYDLNSNSSTVAISYDLYDDKGNLLQYTNKSGISTTIIWGYNGTQAIAKIEGVKYAELAAILNFQNSNVGYKSLDIVSKSDLDNNDSYEKETLIPALIDFKNKSELSEYFITAYSYDPLVGVKSIIQPSGFIEYYVYDGLNKLERILDADNNIIKEFKYHYASTKFYNDIKSQTFTKNDCGSGLTGSSVVYTVPANTYGSYKSKEDANQQAQDDINKYGQSYANSRGSCTYPYCQFNSQSSSSTIAIMYAPFQKVNNVVNAEINFQVINNPNISWPNNEIQLGNIPSPCWPISTTTTTTDQWILTIYPGSGQTVLKWKGSGIPSTSVPYKISISYNVH